MPLVLEAVTRGAPEGARDRGRRHHHLARPAAPRRRARPRRREPPGRRPRASSTEPLFDEDRILIAPDDHPARRARRAWRFADLADHAAPRAERHGVPRRARPRGGRRRHRAAGQGRGRRPAAHRHARLPGLRRRHRARHRRARLARGAAGGGCRSTGSRGARSGWPAGSRGCSPPRPAPCATRSSGVVADARAPAPRASTRRDVTAGRAATGRSAPHDRSPSPSRPTTRGRSSAQITTVAGREVVLVEIDRRAPAGRAVRGRRPHLRRGRRARRCGAGLPLLGVIVVERRRRPRRRRRPARLGHRRPRAGALLGPRPGAARRHRPGRVGAGAAARPGRPRRDDRGRLRVRQRPAHGRDLHRRVARQRPSSAAPASTRSSTGLAALVVPDADAALDALGDLLAYLPSDIDEEPPRWWTDDPVDRPTPEAGDVHPRLAHRRLRRARRRSAPSSTTATCSSCAARWAPNLVTALATIGGRPVGIVANQPMAIAGTLDIPASQKGARFVAFCDAFGLPLLTLVDTPGFYPGKDLEWRGMIRHGAQLAFAYARATVPRVAVVLRKAYGGAYIVMDCRTMGSDLYLAWPSAEIAVMGAKGAVEILHRRETPERAGRARGGLRGALPQPVRGRRPRARRRRHRPRRHPPRGGRRPRAARHQARVARQPQARQLAACRQLGILGETWPRASRSPTTARASRSRCRSSTAASTPPSGASCSRASGSTTRP